MIVGVLVEIAHKNVDKIFDYKVPDELEDDIKIGIRVEVPFGYQKLEGFVLSIKKDSNIDSLKSITSIVDKDIVLNDELLELGQTMHKTLLTPLISCYQAMLPKALKAKRGVVINKKYKAFYRLGDISNYKFNSTQQKIIDCFKDKDVVKREDLLNISPSSLKTLLNKNILIEEKIEDYRTSYKDKNDKLKVLTVDQKRVVESVKLNSSDTYLLHGVTGSGKTEVYIKLIDKVLKMGKTSIVLVPEISLTPQMVERFSSIFGNNIAAIHSALSEGEKYDEWRRIVNGEAKIVIGARSAIFAPLTNLGIIIIDEEHSDSYKQDSSPRYNAKSIAIIRSNKNKCPVIMGSATPSLEAYARAKKGVFKLLELPNRINKKALPKIDIIDMNEEIKHNRGHFSNCLIEAIKDRLEKKEQVILLLNRRGYSSFVMCQNCGHTIKCPHCDITLTYHKTSNTLRCHYCGYGDTLKDVCPNCSTKSIRTLGVGTEKVEEELNKIVDCKILRMDLDTTSKKGMHAKMIEKFKNQEYDILLGTQIVAKGLDFPNVTLVGIINADTSLNIPDFRSSEKTFSLLSQTAGRSGRSIKEGRVIIQTFNPNHYAISYTKKHDYIGFYNKEMSLRKILKYPPYFYICYIRISGKDYKLVGEKANKAKKILVDRLHDTIILGPSPASVFKVNNIYRYGIILKYKNEENLYKTLTFLEDSFSSFNNISFDVDFNPNHF